ncbi:MAG: hypothetical protein A2566_03820 [Candidatus Zambryskibacteria bacterium RIFOXYD1_FULL_40_13]|nr:MAG: hypothetical protein UT25_C0002G0236 [Parcubacteria group bacterium GW2011_GWC1_39_12]KKR19264.1 MAG: hypothetical protein UT49_C0002G0110 [Parcubacteria group bacterium GW2011_GWF1_39_37]KKR35353.1 MAG: hypothetical protein UT68_C0004G0161 [Parcubacteria group bacterium GW2011_GWC2_40_10]KKR52215.1 MAG: hypothetical protein UT89_C0002G0016 [Parcubacteria group bacterium GW2011_GWE1_40_20]KKR65713.1 MAG: hypothetical protein UU06_C0012G0009 [Parcubacteria group bacterium GW2011_GWB1_40_
MFKKISQYFDKVEDRTRGRLSHTPFFYAFLGGIGVVLFWRGVWHTTDFITALLLGVEPFSYAGLLDGPLSLIIGSVLLLITGVFVSVFVGNRLIISGLKGEKKIVEKTEEEILSEENQIEKLQKTLNKVEEKLESIEEQIKK